MVDFKTGYHTCPHCGQANPVYKNLDMKYECYSCGEDVESKKTDFLQSYSMKEKIHVNEIKKIVDIDGRLLTRIITHGCNLRCAFCKNESIYKKGFGIKKNIEEILAIVKAFSLPLVSIEGGEPLLQHGVLTLMKVLKKNNFRVILKVSSEAYKEEFFEDPDELVVHAKPPSSGVRIPWSRILGILKGWKKATTPVVRMEIRAAKDVRFLQEVAMSGYPVEITIKGNLKSRLLKDVMETTPNVRVLEWYSR